MAERRTSVLWIGVAILLLLGVIGYTTGWFGQIFGATFGGTRATVSTQEQFNEGTYSSTTFVNGALQLEQVAP